MEETAEMDRMVVPLDKVVERGELVAMEESEEMRMRLF